MKMLPLVEVRIAHVGGVRRAFYKVAFTGLRQWSPITVKEAEKALRVGRISVGDLDDVPCVRSAA